MKVTKYDNKGKEDGTLEVPELIFGLPWNSDLVHQVVESMQSNTRENNAHTKNRGEVSGGGKKPWRQKGTGRARHGSIRSPIWVGGGVTFGPRNTRNYNKKINKKMGDLALRTILSQKLRDGEVVFVDSLGIGASTKNTSSILKALSKTFPKIDYRMGRRVYIATSEKNDNAIKSVRNIGGTHVEEVRNLNPLVAVSYKYIVIENPAKALKVLEKRIKSGLVKK